MSRTTSHYLFFAGTNGISGTFSCLPLFSLVSVFRALGALPSIKVETTVSTLTGLEFTRNIATTAITPTSMLLNDRASLEPIGGLAGGGELLGGDASGAGLRGGGGGVGGNGGGKGGLGGSDGWDGGKCG